MTTTMTVAHICLTTDHDMDRLLAQQSSRIVKCAQKYGPDRVTILLMVQSGHLSCLQTLEHFLLDTMSAMDPTPAVTTPRWLTSRSITATATTTSTLAPVSLWGIPNVIACQSPEVTTDYLSKLLVPSHSSATVLPRGQISQEDHANNISKPTWLSAALATSSGNPLYSLQDATRLEQGLGTIQNAVLATPAQLQNTCLLTQQTSKAIYDFFNTDQPI
ncbi:hypothetical protein K457DRAFT_900837 [Linnemannia elongata AG-77]|uniref:Uncharacterized protein n=1 Tax=Linnemannia elongata AG-77 TaxID=1314771 RepID=A0A197JM98_9FUNG|nr:hypothetical protein K457DRAFT_900837 [Linnemannia elongata AG-77]